MISSFICCKLLSDNYFTGFKVKRLDFNEFRKYRRASGEFDKKVLKTVEEIINTVRRHGDRALIEFTRKFDRVEQRDFSLTVTPEEFKTAERIAELEYRDLLRYFLNAAENIREYHLKQKTESWSYAKLGNTYGQLVNPVDRAGVYIPGGRAFYPSSILMNVIPAQIAGVPEIIIATPPGIDGQIHPLLIALAGRLGVTRIIKAGGAQAIAALAYGTETVPVVSKITGPGNIFVAAAKKAVMGQVGIDSIAGPSEVMILADDSADPMWVAIDMCAQAEHDPDTTSILVSPSGKLIMDVMRIIWEIVPDMPRKEIIARSLKENALIIQVEDPRQGFEAINLIAPEHAEVILNVDTAQILDKVKNCGALFIGRWTPVAAGDYYAGPNHVIPTNGAAVFSSPLGVYDFVKRTSYLCLSENYLREKGEEIARMAEFEKLDAHALSIKKRIGK